MGSGGEGKKLDGEGRCGEGGSEGVRVWEEMRGEGGGGGYGRTQSEGYWRGGKGAPSGGLGRGAREAARAVATASEGGIRGLAAVLWERVWATHRPLNWAKVVLTWSRKWWESWDPLWFDCSKTVRKACAAGPRRPVASIMKGTTMAGKPMKL